jgi:Spy/CpxP family protein refolding chaperone
METGSLFRKLFARSLGLLIICISASFPALAQDNAPNAEPSVSPANPGAQEPSPSPAKEVRANPDQIKQRRLARLQKIAQLTPEQQSKITPIISQFVDRLIALRNDSSLQPEEKRAKQKDLRRQYSRQLALLLTPEQKQALKNANAGQKPGKGPNQNGNHDGDQRFEQESDQPGSDI